MEERAAKNVLVLLHDDEGQEARLQAGLELTRGLEGLAEGDEVIVNPSNALEQGSKVRPR